LTLIQTAELGTSSDPHQRLFYSFLAYFSPSYQKSLFTFPTVTAGTGQNQPDDLLVTAAKEFACFV